VDDEPLALDRLTRMLEKSERVAVGGSTTDPESALVRDLKARLGW